jgi:hypothetical protein
MWPLGIGLYRRNRPGSEALRHSFAPQDHGYLDLSTNRESSGCSASVRKRLLTAHEHLVENTDPLPVPPLPWRRQYHQLVK